MDGRTVPASVFCSNDPGTGAVGVGSDGVADGVFLAGRVDATGADVEASPGDPQDVSGTVVATSAGKTMHQNDVARRRDARNGLMSPTIQN